MRPKWWLAETEHQWSCNFLERINQRKWETWSLKVNLVILHYINVDVTTQSKVISKKLQDVTFLKFSAIHLNILIQNTVYIWINVSVGDHFICYTVFNLYRKKIIKVQQNLSDHNDMINSLSLVFFEITNG